MSTTQSREVTLLDTMGMLSRATGLPPEFRGMSDFAGQLHGQITTNPALREAALSGNLSSYILSNLPPQIAEAAADPTKRAAAATQAADNANMYSGPGTAAGLNGLNRFANMAMAMREGAGSSARYENAGLQNLTQIQMQARDLAVKSGLGWAADNREILSLGPAGIKALADVQLRQDSYERFRHGGLAPKDIVEGARWAKKNGIDYNEASRAYEGTHQQLNEADKREHGKAVQGLFNSHSAPPAEQEAAKKEFNEKMDGIKKRNPSAAPQIEHEQKVLKTQQRQERAATIKAKAATSENDDLLASLNAPTASASAAPASTTQTAPAQVAQASAAKPEPAGKPATPATAAPATGNADTAKTQQTKVAAPKPNGMG
jgi:hypothetical protein